MKYLKNTPVKVTAIFLGLLLASLLTASCFGGTYAFLGRTYQGAILQVTLEQIVILDEVAFTEEPDAIREIVFQRGESGGNDDSLAGTSWTLESLGELGSQEPAISGVDVTLELLEGGALRGNAGCNNYFSNNYSAAAGVFSAGAVGSTRRACAEPAGVMEQESRVLDMLGEAEFFTVAGDTLTMTVPGQVGDYVIRPSSAENKLMVVRARIGNHAATRAQLDIESLPPEIRLDTGRFKSVNTYEAGVPTEGFHANKNVYVPFIRGSQAVERGFELDGWLIFDVPEGSQVESFKWEAGGDIIIIDN
jgi:heat shock protein HslJ